MTTRCAVRRPSARVASAGSVAVAIVVGLGLFAFARTGDAKEGYGEGRSAAPAYVPWSADVLDVAARVPVQDGGRVMPLDTFASYTLLGVAHRRSTKTADGTRIGGTAWLLDVVFRPEVARRHPCFQVENDETLDAVGLAHEGKKKRDLYAYDDLLPAKDRLRDLASAYHKRPSKSLSPVEGGIVDLHRAMVTFERLAALVDFARAPVDLSGAPALASHFGGRTSVGAAEFLERSGALAPLLASDDPHAGVHGAPPAPAAVPPGAARVAAALSDRARSATGLALLPPPAHLKSIEAWLTPGDALFYLLQGVALPELMNAQLVALARMAASPSDPRAFAAAAEDLRAAGEATSRARGEYGGVALEVTLNRLDPFHRAPHLYLLAFLLVAAGWLVSARWLRGVAWAVLLGTLAFHVVGIVLRCLIRERPPMSTLYDTVLFISGAGVLALAVAEWLDRRGIALTMAPLFGWLGLFVAGRYEALRGEDTMPQLVAVLDTNYWLALHVTCIAIGYLGGLVAAAIAHVTVLGRVLGFKRADPGFYASAARMTYGMLAFGLVFAVVGTILGGVWANDSWGRFWGWDPKENGALMICLAQLAILHARLGGYLKAFGVAMASVAQGMIIAFSWWHVNHLGIGLHSYGHTQGVMTALTIFYAVEGAVLLAGFVHLGLRSGRQPAGAGPAA